MTNRSSNGNCFNGQNVKSSDDPARSTSAQRFREDSRGGAAPHASLLASDRILDQKMSFPLRPGLAPCQKSVEGSSPRGVARSNPLGAGSIHYNVKRERRPSSASAPIISSRASCATRKPASAYHRTGWVVAPTTVMAAVLLRRSNSVDSAKNLSFDASLGAPHTTAHPHRWTLPRL